MYRCFLEDKLPHTVQCSDTYNYTVEPLNKGHLGTRASVLYSEVSFIQRVEMY